MSFKGTPRLNTVLTAVARRAALIAMAALLLFPLFHSAPVLAGDSPKVKEAMQTLMDTTAKLGKPKLDGDVLSFGTTKVNGDYTVVDAVKAKHGATATLFAKKGANFTRVSTNVVKDGQRAVGTILDPSGPAMAAIKQGNAFYGLVDILGNIYDTGYEPIKSDTGEIIGIYYVGYVME
jgi:hypothetical protein